MNQYFTNNQDLKSELRVLKYAYGEYNLVFNSDLGVFSKDRLDEGSRTLLETYFKHGKKNIKALDVGCGYGFIGVSLAKIMDCDVDMIDVNERALHLCKMNLLANKAMANVFNSNIYDQVTKKYDLVITNPPIKAGKAVYLKIINDSFNYLNTEGELWFVMRKSHGVKTVHETLKTKYKTEILCKNKGFFVISVKNQLTNNHNPW